MQNKTILITGVAGMIGTQLVHKLSQDPTFNIIGIDSCLPYDTAQYFKKRLEILNNISSFKFIYGDLLDRHFIQYLFHEFSFDTIIHLAAHAGIADSFKNPQKILFNNYHSFINLIEKIRESKLKYNKEISFIYASSSSVYGGSSGEKTHEDFPLSPLSSYGLSKLQNEQIAQLYCQQYGLNMIGLRFFTAYGEYNRKDMLVHKIFDSITYQKKLTLYQNGNMQRDFCYIQDICTVIQQLIMKEYNQGHTLFNIGGGHPVKISYAVQLIENYLGKKANIELAHDKPSYDPLITYCDNQKISTYLNLNPSFFTPIEDGLQKTCEWYQNLKQTF